MGGALLLLHSDPRPVAHILVGTGQGVEESGFAAVGVAGQGDTHGAAVVGGGIVCRAVYLQLVGVVLHLPPGHFRVRDMPGHGVAGGGGLALGLPHDDLGGVCLSQGQLVSSEADLQRVAQRRDFGDGDLGAGGKAHVDQAALHGPGLVAHGQNGAALSRLQVV